MNNYNHVPREVFYQLPVTMPRNGFTLIELLITTGITILLFAAAIPIFSNLQTSTQLNETATQLVQNTRLARQLSIARDQNSSHGIYFDINPNGPDRYILFQGNSFAVRDTAYDRIVSLDSALSLLSSFASGGNELVFSPAFGMPSTYGTMIITHGTNGTRTISLNSIGKVEEE